MGSCKTRSKKGGVKASKRTPDGQFVPSNDPDAIVPHLFSVFTDFQLASASSKFSTVFRATMITSGQDSIRIRSQLTDPVVGRLSQMQMADRPRHVDLGEILTNCCIKVSIISPSGELDKLTPYNGVKKCAVSSEDALKEVTTQSELYQKLLCVNGGVFIPDVISHLHMNANRWNGFIHPLRGQMNPQTLDAIDWIGRQLAYAPGRTIVLNIMELIPGEFKTLSSIPHESHGFKQATLRAAASLVVLEIKGDGKIPCDAHSGNAMARPDGSALQLIDFGRILNLHDAWDVKVLHGCFRRLCTSPSMPQLKEKLCVFLGCTQAEELYNAVDAEIEFLKRNDPECSKLAASGGHAPQNVHRTLMMIALIDFTFNRYKFSSVHLQCATIMRSVYPVPRMFDGIEEFLDNGRLSFAVFLEKHQNPTGIQIQMAENIAEIAAFIQPMISACERMGPPRRHGDKFRLGPDTPRASDEAVEPLMRTHSSHSSHSSHNAGGRRRRTLRRRR